MDSLFTVYSYGGGEAIYYIFNSIAMLFKSGFSDALFKIMSMAGLVWAAAKTSANKDKFVPYAKWFFGYLMVTAVLIQPTTVFGGKGRTTIYIRDVVTNKAYKVDNLPPGLAVPASIISGLGFSVTKAFETVFTLADRNYLPYHEYGTMFGAQVMSDLRNYKIQNPIFRENIEGYITNCMMYDVMIGKKYDIQTLYHEKDILQLITTNASTLRRFNYRNPNNAGRELVPCKEGITRIANYFNEEPSLLGLKFPFLSRVAGKSAGSNLNKGFLRAMEVSLGFYGSLSGPSASDQLKQILIINAFKDKPASYGAIKAIQHQNTAWKYTGEMAQQLLPILHALFQALVYATFPIIVYLAFFPGGFRVLSTYFGMMIWIELWCPLFAVLNLIVSVFAKSAGGINSITIDNITNIASVQYSYAMAASSLGMLIPVLSYMIIKGGAGQFVHVASQMLGASTSGIAMATQEVTSGNRTLDHISIGDKSFNNLNANKHDSTANIATGYMRRTLSDGTMQTEFASGDTVYNAGPGITKSTGNVSINSMKANQESMSKNIQSIHSVMASEAKEFSTAEQSRQTHAVDWVARVAESQAKGEHYDMHGSVSEVSRAQEVINRTQTIAEQYNNDYSQAASVALGASAGKEGGIIKGSIGADAKAAQLSNQSVSENTSATSRAETDKSLDVITKISKNTNYSDSQTQEKTLADSINTAHETMQQKRQSVSTHESEARQTQEVLDNIQSKGLQSSRNEYHELLGRIANKRDSLGRIGETGAQRIIESGGKAFEGYYLEFQKSKIPDQRMSNWKGGVSVEQINSRLDRANVEDGTQKMKQEVQEEHLAMHDTRNTVAKQKYNEQLKMAETRIQEQRMKTESRGKTIKNKIDIEENTKTKKVLRALGIGRDHPNLNKDWKNE